MNSNLNNFLGARFVIVVGFPMTGKTTLADSIKGFNVIHTDDYIGFGYDNALNVMLPIVNESRLKQPTLVEGVQGFRLLRFLSTTVVQPDLIIYCSAHPHVRVTRCIDRGKNPERTMAMDKGLHTVWREWLDTYPDVPIHYHNT